MMSAHSLAKWWRGDRKILCLFALYGFAAGIVTYIDSTSHGQYLFPNISFSINFLGLIVMFWMDGTIGSPNGFSIFFDPIVMIPYSILAWSFIGLIGYLFIKMFRLGP
jgi:hypothetical protein